MHNVKKYIKVLTCFFLLIAISVNALDRIYPSEVHPLFNSANWGIYIVDLETNKVVCSRRASRLFIPASITKMYTSAATLENLPASLTFNTSVKLSVAPDATGNVFGNVYLVGGADPTLTSKGLQALAKQVYDLGVRTIHGKVMIDDSLLGGTTLPLHGEWEDLQMYYSPEITALSVNENVVHVKISPNAAANSLAHVELVQDVPFCNLVNRVVTVESGEASVKYRRSLTNNEIEVIGTIPTSSQPIDISVAVHRPQSYAKKIFVTALKSHGIQIKNAKFETQSSQATEVAHIASQPLEDILKAINKDSNNLYAELVYRYLNTKADPQVNPLEKMMKEIIGQENYKLFDGSGLSRHNLVTPKQTVALLMRVLKAPYKDVWLNSLTVGGVDGTLKDRFLNLEPGVVVRGKSGGMSDISNLAGFVELPSGKKLVFAIFINNSAWTHDETIKALDALLMQAINARLNVSDDPQELN